MKNDEFGDRMKALEKEFTSQKISPKKWMAVRVDGKGFSKFTKGFKKPFDENIWTAFLETTKAIVSGTGASVGYFQSDEITLLYPPVEGERMFGGKTSKINSVFSSMATAHFNDSGMWKKLALFDCRCWEVDDVSEASNVILWRAQDAKKNSISSHFRWTVGHAEMKGLSGVQMREYLKEHEFPLWEDVEMKYRYGTFVKPRTVTRLLEDEELMKIPEHKRSEFKSTPVVRRVIEEKMSRYFGDLTFSERVEFIQ